MSSFAASPPYIDPQTGIRYETTNPTAKGWMTKQSEWIKDWRRRYFILKGSRLFFAKNEFCAPHGMIELNKCRTVKSAELKVQKRNAIEITTSDATYFVYTDSEKEKDDWIGAIGRAIVQASPTYTADDGVDPHNDDSDVEGF